MTALTPARPHMSVINLIFSSHLHVSIYLCFTFSLYKPKRVFSTLETIFEIFVYGLPSVDLTEMNFILFQGHSSSCLCILSAVSDQMWSVWDLQSLVLLHSGAPVTLTEHWVFISQIRICNLTLTDMG